MWLWSASVLAHKQKSVEYPTLIDRMNNWTKRRQLCLFFILNPIPIEWLFHAYQKERSNEQEMIYSMEFHWNIRGLCSSLLEQQTYPLEEWMILRNHQAVLSQKLWEIKYHNDNILEKPWNTCQIWHSLINR